LNGTRSSGNISLNWSAVAGATSYQVFRSTSSSGPFNLLTTVSVTSASDTIPPNRTYRYIVVALDSCGGSGAQSNIRSFTRP
jgi:fibronectin type 3 domain-containing protein